VGWQGKALGIAFQKEEPAPATWTFANPHPFSRLPILLQANAVTEQSELKLAQVRVDARRTRDID
jgi:hypothetical protein